VAIRGGHESSTLETAWLQSPEVLCEIALLRIAQPKFAHAVIVLDDIGQRLRAPIVETIELG
jgi:hypothetical protein